ncbi:MAG: hypothetical protein IKB28_07495 [Clostridia bacterium]|nr:hypothetical protein [Clostridia bacterium]
MPKSIKRIFLCLLCASMLLGMFACQDEQSEQGTEEVPTQEQIPEIDRSKPQEGPFQNTTDLSFEKQTVTEIEKIVSEEHAYSEDEPDPAFSIGEGRAKKSTVSLNANTLSCFNIGLSFNENVTARYQFKLTSSEPEPEANYDSAYFGLRLSNTGAAPNHESARVWILMKDQKIGLRTGKWPGCTMLPCPVDFSEGVSLIIEDDPVANVISIFYDDAGTKTPLARLVILDDKLEFYLEGSDSPDITEPLSTPVAKTGYARIWTHHMKKAVKLTNIKVSGESTGYTTEPIDMLNSRDVFADTWVATDDADRTTPVGTDTATPGDKKVGIFYFMWHNATKQGQNPLFDHTAAYLSGGVDAVWDLIPQGNLGFAHYWAEPYFGYYNSDDEWVIRKHGYMLAEAGVDFIYVDATNGIIYEHNLETLLRVWSEMRTEGYAVPQICFHCGNTDSLAASSLNFLWNNYYSTGKYADMWFMWDGKPLIFYPDSLAKTLPDEMNEFFTARQSWAFTSDGWYTSKDGKGRWAWADMYPQSPGLSPEGDVEQMIVMCGFWANGSAGTNGGRSYTKKNGIPDYEGDWDFGYALMKTTSGLGLAFQEHFDYAMEVDPPLVMITGWNEWWAGRWGGSVDNPAQGQTICNEYRVNQSVPKYQWYYVDAFNTEYSRDIEPMTGGYNDNYFYQMVQNIRKYKGSRVGEAAFEQWAIDIEGDLGQWYIVGPEYRDYQGDTVDRDHFSYVGDFRYVNTSGRNDFVTCKVSSDADNLYFYAECAEDITAPEGTNWMNLFIDADCNAQTGWYGYDFIINRSQADGKVSVEKFVGTDTWEFETVGEAEYNLRGNVLQIKIARSVMNLGDTFDFKWADNSVADGNVMQFLDQGDAAPNDRFNYRYTTVQTEVKIPEVLTEDMIVLKAGSYNAFAGGKQVRLDASSTKGVMMGRGDEFYLPKAFVEEIIGISCEGLDTYSHYGITYVMPAEAIAAAGKSVTITADGLVVIASSVIEDADTLTTLYRSLM